MALYIRQKPARWYLPAAAASLLWALATCLAAGVQAFRGPDGAVPAGAVLAGDGPLSWYVLPIALVSLGALGGAVALAGRARYARPLFAITLAAALGLLGYLALSGALLTDAWREAALLATIAAAAGAQWRFAHYALRRGWIA